MKGNMGYAIAEGFKITNPNLKILASDTNWNLNRIQKWNDIGSNQTQKNDQILENCRLVVLSVKPQSIQVRSMERSLIKWLVLFSITRREIGYLWSHISERPFSPSVTFKSSAIIHLNFCSRRFHTV